MIWGNGGVGIIDSFFNNNEPEFADNVNMDEHFGGGIIAEEDEQQSQNGMEP